MKERAVLHDVSDGGLSADHPRRSLPIAVAPTTQPDEMNTIRPGLRTVACFRLDDARFGFDSSFIEEEAAEEFAAVAALIDGHPDAPLSIFGHADLTGRDDYNKRLSGRRAEAVYGILTRNVAMWQTLFQKPHGHDAWGHKHIQQMLKATGFFDAEPVEKATKEEREAVRAFQNARGLPVDGFPGPKTRERTLSTRVRHSDG